jgi:energy-coupling factor transporter ATP-binding protein EcfA2
MPDWDDIGDRFWKALTELDVEPLQAEAEKPFRLALVGALGSGKTTLACALADRAPGESGSCEWAQCLPEYNLPLAVDDVPDLGSAALLVLLLDATKGGYVAEVAAADYLCYLGKPMLVCYSKMDLLPTETRLIRGQARWRGTEIKPLRAVHPETVEELLIPAILDVLPGHALSLARHLPRFRRQVAEQVIEHTASLNATYAAASGLAATVPMLRMPLTTQDVDVLCANLAQMTYRLGLAYGLPLNWHQDARAASLAMGAGKLWQQLGTQLLGLLPLWALESKVGLAYGGTLVTGRAIQSWCESGHVLEGRALRAACRSSADRARKTARGLVAKAREALPAAPTRPARPKGLGLRLPTFPKRRPKPVCPSCGRAGPMDAAFCAYCGTRLPVKPANVEEAESGPAPVPAATQATEPETKDESNE